MRNIPVYSAMRDAAVYGPKRPMRILRHSHNIHHPVRVGRTWSYPLGYHSGGYGMIATGISERMEAARKALDEFQDATPAHGKTDADRYRLALAMADALRALIEPPTTMETPEHLADEAIEWSAAHVSGKGIRYQYDDLKAMVVRAVHAGIQAAWESWEAES